MGNMGMAFMEAQENYENWLKEMIKEKGHSVFCNILIPGGQCDCTKPNLKVDDIPRGVLHDEDLDGPDGPHNRPTV